VTLGYGYLVAETENWNYFVTDMVCADSSYQAVCRENGETIELLYGVLQTDEYLMNISYADYSFEGSGGTVMYFTVDNGSTLHSSLWCFDTRTDRFSTVLSEPCSNMSVFREPTEETAGLGWIVYGDMIVPIDLDDGSVYEGGILGIDDMGDMSDISYSFFFSPDDSFKFSLTGAEEPPCIVIQVVTFSPMEETESRISFLFDCVEKTLTRI